MDLLAISLLVRWLLGWALCLRMPRLPASRVQGQPTVSVLIPARNEEFTLPKLLAALRLQSFAPLEVIVIAPMAVVMRPPLAPSSVIVTSPGALRITARVVVVMASLTTTRAAVPAAFVPM